MAVATEEKILATNRAAFHNYHISAKYEAGAALTGTEVKSVLDGRIQLKDSYVGVRDGEAWLFNAHISPYVHGNRANHDPLRTRKLLLRRQEINKLIGKTHQKGLTLIPLRIYFRDGIAKCEIALARGRKVWDRRQTERDKEARREANDAIYQSRRK